MAPGATKWCGRRPSLPYILYMYHETICRRRANKNGDGTLSVLSPFLALEGTRRASDGPRTARSKGPAICRKAGRGVTAAAAGLPRRCGCQSCRLCRPRRRFYRRRVRTPYALFAFSAIIAPNGADGGKQPIYASVSVLKPGKITDQKMMNFSILQIRDFYTHIWACFGAKRRQFSAVYHVA